MRVVQTRYYKKKVGVVFFILTGLERRLTCVEEREHIQYKVNGID